jgi:DNA (cytosine-5)-methyltransferase 1
MAHRVDRLKAIGNGQVPLVAATAWKILGGE